MQHSARVLVLLATGLLACSGRGGAEGPKPLARMLVRTSPLAQRTARLERRYAGYTHPWEAHGVGFLVGGRVTGLKVAEGDVVRRGQLLATLAPEDYALVKRLADVQVAAIKPNYERVDALVRDKALPAATVDEVRGRYEAAVTQSRQAERQLDYTRLRAPCDGVVMERRTAVGQVIGPGMPAVVVLDLSRVKVKFGVPQQDLGLFRQGAAVSLSFPGVDGTRDGTVHSIGFVPDLRTRTYEVAVEVDNADGTLRAGMLAHATLVVREAEGLFVPVGAIRTNAAREPAVYVVDPATSRVAERPVKTGRLFGEDLEVLSGLTAGDAIIVEGQGFVSPGDEVRTR